MSRADKDFKLNFVSLTKWYCCVILCCVGWNEQETLLKVYMEIEEKNHPYR